MALTNVFGANYTIIDDISLSLQRNAISFQLKTFTDSSKKASVNDMNLQIWAQVDPIVVNGANTNTPPAHVNGEKYAVGNAPTGDFVGFEGSIMESDGTNWSEIVSGPVDDGSDRLIWDGTQWTIHPNYMTASEWNAIWGATYLDTVNINVYKATYDYIKTRSDFSAATDV